MAAVTANAQPSTSGKLIDRDVSVGPGAAQSQALPFGGSGPEQSQLLLCRARVYSEASASFSPLDPAFKMGEGTIVTL